MKDYLNPKGMLAPGTFGSTTTMVSGTLATQFGWPGHLTALVVSFMFGMMVFSDKKMPLLQRIILYIINSLVIFTMAAGINSAGVAATSSMRHAEVKTRAVKEAVKEEVKEPKTLPFFHSWF